MKISKDERADIRNMWVGMSKKVYKEMVKEMDKIASQEELSQQQRASNVICNYWIFRSLGTLNINFQEFSCRKEKKMEPSQHIKHNDKEEKGWYLSLWVIVTSL